MNRILEINDELAYAVVEPGVRWFDLYDAVKDAGYSLMTPCPDLGWGSVIGNSMDSGHSYQFYGADYAFPTGFEVVLPDGQLLRTGAGAIPGSKVWHLYKRSLGPSLDPLFVQSNLGIVTRMGVWLKRLPEAYAPVMLAIDDDGDLEAAIDTIRELRLAGHLEGVPTLYSTLRAAVMLRDEAGVPGLLTPAQVDDIAKRAGVGAWATRAAIWGDADIVQIRLQRITEAWAKIPSGRLVAPRIYAPEEYDQIVYSADQIMAGIPTLKAIENMPPHIAHVDFSPIVPMQGTEVRFVTEEIRKHLADGGVNFSAAVMFTGERSGVVLSGVRYDKTDAGAVRNAFDVVKGMVSALGQAGYGVCRPHLNFMDLAAAQYSFNDHAYRRFVEKIKDAVDPKGVLSPGRHGIWPAAYRDGTA
jgi:4-cresol dehydrogenase (hydroxylating)